MTRRAPVFRWMVDAQGHRMPVRVGELTQETSRWEFVFDPDYLAMGTSAWELDPTGIRRKQGSAFVVTGVAPHPVFCDVALSGWSRGVLQNTLRALPSASAGAATDEPWGWWERLLYAPPDGFGALFVGSLADKPPAEALLAAAAASLTEQSLRDASLESSSGAMGGERPKIAATYRSAPDGIDTPVLLKFALPSERADSVVAEATALTLSAELGLRVPAHGVQRVHDVLALRIARFDREPGPHGAVHHCVSADTALGLYPSSDVEDPRRSYVLLRSKLREPGDGLELFRRIVLNAAVGNGDDHPWNTSLRQVGLGTWELSPLYDVMPFFHRTGMTTFRMALTRSGGKAASLANLLAAGRELAGLVPDAAQAQIVDIFASVRARWRAIFERHAAGLAGVHPEDWTAVFASELPTR